MALLDSFKTYRKNRQIARSLERIAGAVERLADAAERQSPPATVPQADSVEVSDPDDSQQARYEITAYDFYQRNGREPSPDELMAHYGQVKHLF